MASLKNDHLIPNEDFFPYSLFSSWLHALLTVSLLEWKPIQLLIYEVKVNIYIGFWTNGRGKPTASSLSANGFPLMAGPNFQPSDGIPTEISILRQLADGPKMSRKCSRFILWVTGF